MNQAPCSESMALLSVVKVIRAVFGLIPPNFARTRVQNTRVSSILANKLERGFTRTPHEALSPRTARDFIAFLQVLDKQVEPELEVHIILDNLSAHKAPSVKRWLVRHTRFHLHFTPTYSSWLNLVERFFGLLTDEALKRGSHSSIPQLRKAIMDYVDVHNEEGKPFIWTKTTNEILDKIRDFGQRTLQLHGNA